MPTFMFCIILNKIKLSTKYDDITIANESIKKWLYLKLLTVAIQRSYKKNQIKKYLIKMHNIQCIIFKYVQYLSNYSSLSIANKDKYLYINDNCTCVIELSLSTSTKQNCREMENYIPKYSL